ncbi:MAG TPA: DinB family protein [Ktedonobacterales bacterium]|nr:DinB family protein [Ktedonobacterales bacterium]
MAEDNFTLATFYASWKAYQDHLKDALALLTAEQIALRAAPGMRSIAENALHIVGCRTFWFTGFLGEDGGETMKEYTRWNEVALRAPYARWNEVAQALGTPAPIAAELAQGLDDTWRFMADRLTHWSAADMRQTFPDEEDGAPIEISRAWVVWHVLEHDLHHGGEISLTLGMHGIPATFAV